jgi:hypothetical protein
MVGTAGFGTVALGGSVGAFESIARIGIVGMSSGVRMTVSPRGLAAGSFGSDSGTMVEPSHSGAGSMSVKALAQAICSLVNFRDMAPSPTFPNRVLSLKAMRGRRPHSPE